MQPKTTKHQQAPKPRRQAHRPKRIRAAKDTFIIERIYAPDVERQMAGLCILLGLPYTRPTGKAA